jgi:hypothetical protein
MQMLDYNPYVNFKSPLLYDWLCLLNFSPLQIFLFKLAILIHKYLCQIEDFTMHLWHLNRIHSTKSP